MSTAAATTAVSVRLPALQRVSRYDLALVPDLTHFTFQGQVTITMETTADASAIVLNALELEFPLGADGRPDVQLRSVGSDSSAVAPRRCERLTLDAVAQTVTIEFGATIAAGAYLLDITYTGVLNDQLAGFYRSKYVTADGSAKYMAVTQFEATDCRRAMPCVDEPAAKAIFDVTLIVDPSLSAVSNMPVLEKTTTRSSEEDSSAVRRGLTYPAGLARYRYYPSPIMSTYLLAFVIGEFDYISSTSSSGTEVRVYTGLGKTHLGRFSLDTAVKALDFYNQYFGVSYPLPKMDLLAIPDFAAGAMENCQLGGDTVVEAQLQAPRGFGRGCGGSGRHSHKYTTIMLITPLDFVVLHV